MKEKEIRERIERFLKRTARNLVVPASVGLSLSGCDTHALRGVRADAGRDVAVQGADVADATTQSDLPSDLSSDPSSDLPSLVPPYLVIMLPDAAEVGTADVQSEAHALPDASPEIQAPPPPYMVPPPPPYMVPPPPPPLPDAGPEVPLPPPPPPYLLLPSLSRSVFGGTAPLPLVPKKNG